MRLVLALVLAILYAGSAFSQADTAAIAPLSPEQIQSRLSDARTALADGKLRAGWKLVKEVLDTDSMNIDALRLRGECSVAYGSSSVYDAIDKLRKLGDDYFVDLLRLKVLLFLGDSRFPDSLAHFQAMYADSAEVKVLAWLYRLDKERVLPDTAEIAAIAEGIVMKSAPYRASYVIAADHTDADGLAYLELLYSHASTRLGKDLERLRARRTLNTRIAVNGASSLEYADCDIEMGMYLVDASGNKIKMAFDTGSGSRLFTIHHRDVGDRLDGDTVLVIEDGIQYNYMKEPADIVMKAVDFSNPPMTEFPVEYFEGGFQSADGCFSPFALPDIAITIDPINKKVTLRDHDAYRTWRDSLTEGTFADLPVTLRDGWPFVPITVNGYTTLMMVETGSRDVNFNEIAAREYGLKPYDSVLIWNEKEYPTKMVDATINVGGFDYEVKGGLVTDWALGNHAYGLADAGDLGPKFMRNFIFTFDPWNSRLILIKPDGAKKHES